MQLRREISRKRVKRMEMAMIQLTMWVLLPVVGLVPLQCIVMEQYGYFNYGKRISVKKR